jgi:hypothetical protein
VKPVAERDALNRASSRALERVTHGVFLLVMIVPLIVLGGVVAAIFHGSAERLVVDVTVIACGVCAVLGFLVLAVGLVRHTRAERRLRALDHSTLPEARVVR